MKLKYPRPRSGSDHQRLSRVIRHTIRVGLIVSGSLIGIQAGMADTTNDRGTTDLGRVEVGPPIQVDPWYPPVAPPDIGYDPSEGGGNGGSGGNFNGEDARRIVCTGLIASKPKMCPSPIPIPSGASYASDRLPGASWGAKSTMLMAIAFAEGRTYGLSRMVPPAPAAQETMQFLLAQQTQLFADPGFSFDSANGMFAAHLAEACRLQAEASNLGRIGGELTIPERQCYTIMQAFQNEVRGPGFVEFFADWSKRYGIPLEEFATPYVTGSVELEKSVVTKWQVVSDDATCSRWWTTYEQNQCTVQ